MGDAVPPVADQAKQNGNAAPPESGRIFVPAMPEPAPGIRSTEFYLTIALIVLSTIEGALGMLPPQLAAKLSAAILVAYKLIRLLIKLHSQKLQADVLMAQIDAEKTGAALIAAPAGKGGLL